MGSVKDLEVIKKPTDKKPGVGRFDFSDRYSVFDWGEMPDHIPHKGQTLCIMTAYFFEKLENEGIKTHYCGVVENGQVKLLTDVENPPNEIEVSLVNVVKPEYTGNSYDYSVYDENSSNCLIPLEIIYRNTLPEHSSFRRRAANGEIDIVDYGLKEMPEPGVFLAHPIYDVSTKLEGSDRYISWKEARDIAGLDDESYQKVIKLLTRVNQLINREVEKAGLKNLDGKIELAFDNKRNLMVVDAVGTPDECRFSYNGFSISKEAIRKYYRHSDWYKELVKVKEETGPTWRNQVSRKPEALPEDILKLVSQLYMACANEVTGYEWFKGINTIAEIQKKLEKKI